jgi:general secretion pathway protein G
MAAPLPLDYAPRERLNALLSLPSPLEATLVLLLLAILAAVVVPRFTSHGCGPARQSAAQADIGVCATALDRFRRDVGTYPTAADGLAAFLNPPPSARGWNGPYLRRPPIDPRGRPYAYLPATASAPPRVTSAGPDGVQGNADDVAAPK